MMKKITKINNMVDLYSIFSGICPTEGDEKYFPVEDISSNLPHKIGSTKERYPIFFVECCDELSSTNISLKQFSVTFNQACNLKASSGETVCKKYTLILLKSLESDIQKYFLDLVYIVLSKLSPKPSVISLKHEISKVISLFTAPPSFSKEVIKGLWAELFVIACSNDPKYLIDSWHVSAEDKYDFNDGIDKIEVKATHNQERVHAFSIEQLNPNKGSELLIASVIVAPSGQGTNIFDLIDYISSKLTDTDSILKLKEVSYQTIGPHLEESKKIRFDLSMASNTYKLYDYRIVASIPLSAVPIEVSHVHFSSCLKDKATADLKSSTSKLHKSL